jgi:cyclophilin family peptidyl-prolyl cis-trans isomerase
MRSMRASLFLLLLVALAPLALAQNAADLEAVVTTDLGSFRIQFFPEAAPKHVAQFFSYSQKGFYDGTAFFRAVANGVIQGGDPLLKNPATPRARWGTGGFNTLPSEPSNLKHVRGTVSAVHLQNKADSDGSQFFVCVSPQPALDGKYTVFGEVTEGMDVVEQISRVPVDENGLTQTPVRILKVSTEPKKTEPYANASLEELRKVVTMNTTLGTIRIQMEPDWARDAVQRFLMLTATGWYDHTAFHRIAKGFVIQGGTGETRASGPTHPADRWVHPLKAEFRGDLKHVRGVVSMAHGDNPNSATTSFFIVLGPAPHLDGNFAAFGRVVQGMEVLDAFEREDVDGETPKRRLEILSAKIEPSLP